MSSVVVLDLDEVLLDGDASTLFLRGRLGRSPGRLLPLLLASPVLLPGSAVPHSRPLAARLMTRIAVGGRAGSDVDAVADAYRRALTRKPGAAIADAVACVRRHRAEGDLVVVATGCEETLARGFLRAIDLGDSDVVGSTGDLWPPRVRWAMRESKVRMLTERCYPPPWEAVCSDSPSDLPLFAGTPRPVLVNGDEKAARRVERTLGRRPGTVTWR